jgi:hypothetical protein
VKLFYAASGDSTVVTGKMGNIEIGAVPTLDLNTYGVPVVLTAPTWVTVGPSSTGIAVSPAAARWRSARP